MFNSISRKKNFLFFHVLLISLLFTTIPGCSSAAIKDSELVISTPVETTLKSFGLRSSSVVWEEAVSSAEERIDLAFFYLVSREKSLLEPVINKLIRKAESGVSIRILTEKKMKGNSKKMIERLKKFKNIEIRTFDWKNLTGGILHAKYFIIDKKAAFIGSQNFDWRSLEHIQETGVYIKEKNIVSDLLKIFNLDWRYCGGETGVYDKNKNNSQSNSSGKTFLTASPAKLNPPGIKDTLSTILKKINNAKKRISVQLLSYSTFIWKSEKKFNVLNDALKRAAARGVIVRIIVSNWNLRKPGIESIRELAKTDGITIKFINIPVSKKGFIPYSRVVHSKIMRIDSDLSMISTSNWSRDYFMSSRNVEVFTSDKIIAENLDRIFNNIWESSYAKILLPTGEYAPPRIYFPKF